MDKWEPSVRKSKNKIIIVEARKGEDEYFSSDLWITGNYEVSPPNFFERLLGMTLESKLKSAERSCKIACDALNKRDEEIKNREKEIDKLLEARCANGDKRLL